MSERETPLRGAEAVTPELGRPEGDIRTTYHRLRMGGLTPTEAGNLTAHLTGLRVSGQSWTLQQVEHLLFLRSIVDAGRLAP